MPRNMIFRTLGRESRKLHSARRKIAFRETGAGVLVLLPSSDGQVF
jgi:hypothetical protein